ncbi:GyrI-like domain-containing protein [Candidatus Falkowbacteria bacterium]|jgi:AraC family transcriptional regulator|nr:GyrI-like domain-containing protein [Candidatus Falkowbacteria bacterium]MBT7007106.1 GyrI-like domain-containing protein [Candidatus Falkowbacteria bacterium]
MQNDQINLTELPEKKVACVSFQGNYVANPEVFKNLFEKLCGWAGPKGLLNQKVEMLSSYQDDPHVTPPEKLRVDVCLVVEGDIEVDGEVSMKTLPGGKYLVMSAELDGPEEYGLAWQKVVDWANENSYVLDMSRPSYEIYKNEPQSHPEGHHLLDVCLSVKE